MRPKCLIVQNFVVLLLFVCLLTPFNAVAQDQQAVIITADQPNIWTLEQAHYLLAQMHRRNLDLKASPLNELNANEINGVNIDVLKTLLEVSAEFDEAKAFNNSIRKDQKQFDAGRRQSLIEKRSQLQDESLTLTRQIAEQKIKKSQAGTDAEKEKIQPQINELEIVQAAVKEQISQINIELETLNSVSGDFEKFTPGGGFDKSKFPDSLNSSFADTVKTVLQGFNNSPQLNASLRLENYLQMQYEILSKQLTLLRDEVGPGERLIFLEMPQSIRTTYEKSNKKWAQSWWKIRAYSTCNEVINETQSKYERLANKIQLVIYGLSEIKESYTSINKTIRDNSIPLIAAQQTALDTAKTKLEDAEKKAKTIAALGKKTPSELYSVNGEYIAERTAAKDKLEDMFKDSLSKISEAITALETAANDKDAIKALVTIKPTVGAEAARKESERVASIQAKIEAQYVELTKELGELKKEEINDSHLVWLKLKISDILTKAVNNTLISEITTNMNGFSFKTPVDLAKDLLNPKNADENLSSPCNSSDTPYDTGSVIKGLIEGGDTNRLIDVVDLDKGLNLDKGLAPKSPLYKILETEIPSGSEKYAPKLENREARIIDLFPRQSSLNVNDVKLRQSALSIRGILSLISGFGTNINYQRSRERFSQFVQQELYASAFGKGSREFGWTFYPMPGTDRLLSGVRTTYAIMIVPQNATSILLQTTGCYYQRSEKQLPDFDTALGFKQADRWRKKGQCSDNKSFIIPIPSSNNAFWVERVEYQAAEMSKKITVSIRGRDFSSQIGILVDGVPLRPSLGLGQPFIVDDSRTKDMVTNDSQIKGSFERVDTKQIIASFEMGKDYKGTPTITLIAPGKGLVLNSLNDLKIRVKGTEIEGLNNAPFMFGIRSNAPNPNEIKIGEIKVFEKAGQKLKAVITGDNLNLVDKIDVNGDTTPLNNSDKTKSLILLEFTNNGDKDLYFSLIQNDTTVPSKAIANPAPRKPEDSNPSIDGYTEKPDVLLIENVEYLKTRSKVDCECPEEFVVFKLTGKGFRNKKMRISDGFFRQISDTAAFLEVEKSKTPLVITLIDDENKLITKKEIVGEPPQPPKKPKTKKKQ